MPTPAPAPSPVGQAASYEVDTKTPGRTSSAVQDGTVTVKVTGQDASNGAYVTQITYSLDVTLLGHQQGSQNVDIPADFYGSQFLSQLVANGSYSTSYFTATYEGLANATTLDGHTYTGCYKVLLNNFQAPSTLQAMTDSFVGFTGGGASSISNLQATVLIQPGIPVLGAVTIDLSFSAGTQAFKVGADYLSN